WVRSSESAGWNRHFRRRWAYTGRQYTATSESRASRRMSGSSSRIASTTERRVVGKPPCGVGGGGNMARGKVEAGRPRRHRTRLDKAIRPQHVLATLCNPCRRRLYEKARDRVCHLHNGLCGGRGDRIVLRVP